MQKNRNAQIIDKVYGDLKQGAPYYVALCLFFTCLYTHAEIYKWTDKQGRVHFSDQVPTTASAEVIGDNLNINSYQGTEVTTADFFNQRDADRKGKARLKRHPVVMYSTVWCGVCKRAREYFKARNISFKEYDVETSFKGKADFERMEGRGVPIILMGKKRMNGFDPVRFKAFYSR